MQQFVAGFVVALLTIVPVLAFVLHRRVRRILKSRNDRTQQLEQLSKLTGGLAHEIKNPLSTIKINLKLIAEELDRPGPAQSSAAASNIAGQGLERAIRKIAVIQKETDRLEHILDGFLRYIDRTELRLADADINELVGDMIDFYSPQAYAHAITVRQGLHKAPLICRIDADMLKQAILNLFINAQQAMDNGGELMIRTEQQKKDAIISISDTGCGIAPDKLPRIFDAYYSSRPHSSGLGLPTTKKIIEAHGGSMVAQSDLGKGTSFAIRLPLLAK